MIRVVLAVALATALLGASLPVAERAERDRNAALATGELQRLADRAAHLAADNDPVPPEADPAAATVSIAPPDPQFTSGGRIVVADDRLVWQPERGGNETVESPVPVRAESSVRIVEETTLRLSFVRTDDGAVVRVERRRGDRPVAEGSRPKAGPDPPCSETCSNGSRTAGATRPSRATASSSTATTAPARVGSPRRPPAGRPR